MLTKTRSDLLMTVEICLDKLTPEEKDKLIKTMYYKIVQAYEIVHALEKDKQFEELGLLLRKALES